MLATPPQSRSVRGGGVGFSPAGNRFWLLTGEEPDEETGASSEDSGMIVNVCKYLLPYRGGVMDKQREVNTKKRMKAGLDPTKRSKNYAKNSERGENIDRANEMRRRDSAIGEKNWVEYEMNIMSGNTVQKIMWGGGGPTIPDIWSETGLEDHLMFIPNCEVNTTYGSNNTYSFGEKARGKKSEIGKNTCKVSIVYDSRITYNKKRKTVIGDGQIDNWAIDLSPERDHWIGPVESEKSKQNILCDAFSYINWLP